MVFTMSQSLARQPPRESQQQVPVVSFAPIPQELGLNFSGATLALRCLCSLSVLIGDPASRHEAINPCRANINLTPPRRGEGAALDRTGQQRIQAPQHGGRAVLFLEPDWLGRTDHRSVYNRKETHWCHQTLQRKMM